MDYMVQEQERGITITSAATNCFWARSKARTRACAPHQHHRHPRPRRLHHRGRALPPRARRRRRGARRRQRRRAPDRDGLAPGRQVRVPRIVFVNKMDKLGADFEMNVRRSASASASSPCRSSTRWAKKTSTAAWSTSSACRRASSTRSRAARSTPGWRGDPQAREGALGPRGEGEGLPRADDRGLRRHRRRHHGEIPRRQSRRGHRGKRSSRRSARAARPSSSSRCSAARRSRTRASSSSSTRS
jgi:hypothetical protein